MHIYISTYTVNKVLWIATIFIFLANTEGNIPKENLLYTVQDLAKEVKDSLDKFDKKHTKWTDR